MPRVKLKIIWILDWFQVLNLCAVNEVMPGRRSVFGNAVICAIGVTSQCYCREFADWHTEAEAEEKWADYCRSAAMLVATMCDIELPWRDLRIITIKHSESANFRQGLGVTTAPRRPRNAGGRRIKGALCRWDKEILALGSNTSPERGPIRGVFCRGPQNLKLRHWLRQLYPKSNVSWAGRRIANKI